MEGQACIMLGQIRFGNIDSSQKMFPTCALPEIDGWRLKDCLRFGKGQVVNVFFSSHVLLVSRTLFMCVFFLWKGLGCQQSQKHLYAFFKEEKPYQQMFHICFDDVVIPFYQTNNINNLVFLIAPSQKVIGSCTYMMTSSLYFCRVNRDPMTFTLKPWQDASSPGAVSKAQQKSWGHFNAQRIHGMNGIYLPTKSTKCTTGYKVSLSQYSGKCPVVWNSNRGTGWPLSNNPFEKIPGRQILFPPTKNSGVMQSGQIIVTHSLTPQGKEGKWDQPPYFREIS